MKCFFERIEVPVRWLVVPGISISWVLSLNPSGHHHACPHSHCYRVSAWAVKRWERERVEGQPNHENLGLQDECFIDEFRPAWATKSDSMDSFIFLFRSRQWKMFQFWLHRAGLKVRPVCEREKTGETNFVRGELLINGASDHCLWNTTSKCCWVMFKPWICVETYADKWWFVPPPKAYADKPYSVDEVQHSNGAFGAVEKPMTLDIMWTQGMDLGYPQKLIH